MKCEHFPKQLQKVLNSDCVFGFGKASFGILCSEDMVLHLEGFPLFITTLEQSVNMLTFWQGCFFFAKPSQCALFIALKGAELLDGIFSHSQYV